MVKVIALLVYLWQSEPTLAPELVIERHAYDTLEECQEKGGARAVKLMEDPKFFSGVFSGCVPSRVLEVSLNKEGSLNG